MSVVSAANDADVSYIDDEIVSDEYLELSDSEMGISDIDYDDIESDMLENEIKENGLSDNNDVLKSNLPENEFKESNYNEYYEDIMNSNSQKYGEFINYLINNKSFEFRENSLSEDGYFLYATKNYTLRLWDGVNYTILKDDSYFASTAEKSGYFVNESYYDDIIYYHEYNYYLDEEFLGWLMWNANYKKVFVSGSIEDKVDISSVVNPEKGGSPKSGNLPSSYDLRDYGFVTPVKDQGNTANCWAFATMAALESHLLKTENTSYTLSPQWDFSENNLKNVMSSLGRNGTDKLVNSGGNMLMSLAYLIRWSGPINESDDPYNSNYTNISEDVYPLKHVQGVKFIPNRQNYLDNDYIKESVLENGAVYISMYWDSFFEKNDAYYFYNGSGYNFNSNYMHAVTIVGWDDNYPKNNFLIQSEGMGNGAFIIKNSWGTNAGNNGYYYVSYYDQMLGFDNTYAGFAFTNVENVTNYDYNYNYNPLGFTNVFPVNSTSAKFANQWAALKSGTLKSFGLYVVSPSICTANLIVNGISIGNTTSYLSSAGFHTILFNQAAYVNVGQTFRVEITLQHIGSSHTYIPLEERIENYSNVVSGYNQSFLWLRKNGVDQWVDLKTEVDNANICLHVYTECIEGLLETHVRSNNLVTYFNTSSLNATLVDGSGNPIANKLIYFNLLNVTYNRTTDSNGKVSLPIHLNPGSYKFLISFLGDSIYHKSNRLVNVKVNKMHTNINQNVSTVHQGEYLGLILKDSNGKALSGQKVAFCLLSVTYNRTTDSAGKAKLLIRLNPRKYTFTLKFFGTAGYYACNKTFNLTVLSAKSGQSYEMGIDDYDGKNIDENIIINNETFESSDVVNNDIMYMYNDTQYYNIINEDKGYYNNHSNDINFELLDNDQNYIYSDLNLLELLNNDQNDICFDLNLLEYIDFDKTDYYNDNLYNLEHYYMKDSFTETENLYISENKLNIHDFNQKR